jgi:hypothetical protein
MTYLIRLDRPRRLPNSQTAGTTITAQTQRGHIRQGREPRAIISFRPDHKGLGTEG